MFPIFHHVELTAGPSVVKLLELYGVTTDFICFNFAMCPAFTGKNDHMLSFFSCFSGYSRPTSLQDRGRDSDDEDFRDRDYDVAALASNLSQAFKYGIYSNEDIDEVSFSHFFSTAQIFIYI